MIVHRMMFFEGDEVKIKEEKIKTLFYSNPKYLKEEDGMIKPESFLKKNTGIILECDWDKRKRKWSHFVEITDKKTKNKERLWFLEDELILI